MNQDHLKRLLETTTSEWNSWVTQNDPLNVDLSGAKLPGHDFRGKILERANFERADLQNAKLDGTNLANAKLSHADLRSANLRESNLHHADLSGANMGNADLFRAKASGANFFETNCRSASFVYCDLRGSRISQSDCVAADFESANFEASHIGVTDLRYASFKGCNITSAKFMFCRFGHNNLKSIEHDASQIPIQDFTETIKYVHPLHWGKIRTIGKLPLFSASYTTLGFGVTYANCVAALNRTKVLTILRYPIEVPSRISWIMVASLLLAVGATLYAVFCPKRVQEFSEVQWTEGMNRSRLQYLAEAWRSPWVMYATFACTCAGGLIAFWLFLELLVSALWFVFTPLGPDQIKAISLPETK